jgi:hypothetical protein
MPEGILSEENRSKLDGIVTKMKANNESEENIQFVVNDFKSKYSTVKKKDATELSLESGSTDGKLDNLYAPFRYDPSRKSVDTQNKYGFEKETTRDPNLTHVKGMGIIPDRKKTIAEIVKEDHTPYKLTSPETEPEAPEFEWSTKERDKLIQEEKERVINDANSGVVGKASVGHLANKYDPVINELVGNIDGILIGKNEEEVKLRIESLINNSDALSKHMSGDGAPMFSFNETGWGYDALEVINNYTGDKIVVSLDNWTTERDNSEANILREFLRINMENPEYSRVTDDINKKYEELESIPDWDINTRNKTQDEISRLIDTRESTRAVMRSKSKDTNFESYAFLKLKPYSTIDGDFQYFQQESNRIQSSPAVRERDQLIEDIDKVDLSDPEEKKRYYEKIDAYNKEISKDLESLQLKGKELSLRQIDLEEIAGGSNLVAEERGNWGSGILRSFTKGVSSPMAFIGNAGATGDARVTSGDIASQVFYDSGTINDEFFSSENRSLLEKAVFGVTESIGATVGGMMTGGPGNMGSMFGLYTMGYNSSMDEMNSPEFANVSRHEKVLYSSVYGATIGILEQFGISRMFSKTPGGNKIINSILSKAFKKMPKGASAETMETIIKENIGISIANKTLNVGAAGLIEGGVETSQTLAEIGLKEVFNSLNGEAEFDTDGLWSTLPESFMVGLVGGSSFNAVTQVSRLPIETWDNHSFKKISDLVENPELMEIYNKHLKTRVMNGEITKGEAAQAVESMNELYSDLNKMPEGLTTEDKFSALSLMREKSELEKAIEGKDKALVEKENLRINEINEELKSISTGKPVEVEEVITKEEAAEQAEKTPPGAKLFSDPNPETKQIADKYKKDKGITTPEGEAFRELDEARSKELADAYQAMKDDPSNPEVKEAYEAMASETMDQYQAMQESGYTIELWEGEGEPYANSGEMIADVRDNKHMYVLSTENEFGDDPISDQKRSENPLLKDSGIKDVNGKTLLINDIFRGVHDFFGHTERGNSFGPKGEENAWDVHARMYSDKARRAMTTETRGQNSYVNFSGVNAEAKAKFAQANKLEKEGEIDEANKLREEARSEFKFAEQKIGLMPEEFSNIEEKYTKVKPDTAYTPSEFSKKETPKKESFESLLTKSTEKATEAIDATIKKLDDFGKETLGVNIPVVVAKKALQAAKIAMKTTNEFSKIVDAAIQNVKESDWYKGLSAKDKKSAEANIPKLFTEPESVIDKPVKKKPKTPTQKKIDKVVEPKKKAVKVPSEMAALKDQIKLEAKAAREASLSEKNTRKAIANKLKHTLAKDLKGKFNARQVSAIYKRALEMNLSNPVMEDRFIDYVKKVYADAEYQNKLSNAYAVKRQVSKKMKSKNQQAELARLGSKFVNIDPRSVKDIDQYNEVASDIKKSLTATRLFGSDILYRGTVNIEETMKYIDKAIDNQNEIAKNMMELQFPEMFESGVLNQDMSIQEMREIMSDIEGNVKNKVDESKLRDQVGSAIDVYSRVISDMLKTKKDPFTGETLDISANQERLIKMLTDVNVDALSLKEMLDLVDLLSNFSVNTATGNVATFALAKMGRENAHNFLKKYGSTGEGTLLSRDYGAWFMSLDMLIEYVLASGTKADIFMDMSGLSDFINQANKAQKMSEAVLDEYLKKFKKTKPNKDYFNSSKNTYERGMYAFLTRSKGGSEIDIDKEFKRRAKLIKETIEYLNSEESSKKEKRKGEIYKEIAEKFGLYDKDASVEKVSDNVDKTNKQAVKWWVDKWSEHSQEMRDTALAIYNKELDTDLNYTPDRFRTRDQVISDQDKVEAKAQASVSKGGIYANESGSLMEATNPGKLPDDRVIDLDFDTNNGKMFESAIIDINTAEATKQLSGFKGSDAFKKIFKGKNAELISRRIDEYVVRKRKPGLNQSESSRIIKNATNLAAKTGVVYALGSIAQSVKQTVPVAFNTMINSGRLSVGDAMTSQAHKWINESGLPISRRGLESETTLTTGEQNLKRHVRTLEAANKYANALGDFYLKTFLQKPDVFVARASFISYYKQYMKRQGMSSDIDYTQPMNKKAAQYAQRMVNRQQNVSDVDMAGDFWTDKHGAQDFIRKTLFPFANFLMNQKARTYTDLKVLLSTKKNWNHANAGDVGIAARSLGGLAVEMVMFHAISTVIREAYKEVARNITGADPEEEDYYVNKAVEEENDRRKANKQKPMSEEEERTFRRNKWHEVLREKSTKSLLTSITRDLLSPIPILDTPVIKTVNEGLKWKNKGNHTEELKLAIDVENELRNQRGKNPMSDSDVEDFTEKFLDEKVFQLWDFNDDSYGRQFGTIGIAVDKYIEYGEVSDIANKGYYKDKYGNRKYLLPEDVEAAQATSLMMRLYLWGVLPADFGSIARYGLKDIKRSGFTEAQIEKYKELESEVGKPTKKQIRMIKDKDKKGVKSILKETLSEEDYETYLDNKFYSEQDSF